MSDPPFRVRRADWLGLAGLAAVSAVAWLLVQPAADVPLVDDWVYAWSVKHLVRTGSLQILEISAIYPVVHILLGGATASLFGFSFEALRLSTIVVSTAGCWALFFTLRELRCRPDTAFLGGAALALHPVYFALTFSFMTEVPFISLSTMALYWYVRAVQRNQPRSLWVGGICALAAFLVRPIGILLPLAAAPVVLTVPDWRASVKRASAPLGATVMTMLALQMLLPHWLGPLDWAGVRQNYLRWLFTVSWREYAEWNVNLLFVAAFPFLPVAVGMLCARRRWKPVAIVAVALMVGCWLTLGRVPPAVPDWQTWSLQEFTARSLIAGNLSPSPWSASAAPVVNVLGALALATLLTAIAGRSEGGLSRSRAGAVILLLGVLHVGAINALWFYNDRYYVVLAPVLAIVCASSIDTSRIGRTVAAALLLVWAAVDITGVRDMLGVNEAVAQTARELEAQDVPPYEIDTGWSLNGWRLYAHPEHLPEGADRRYDVPFVTSKRQTRYVIAKNPIADGETIRTIPLPHATWQVSHRLVLIHRSVTDDGPPQ